MKRANEMTDGILRHMPGLRPQLRRLDIAFVPWPKAAPGELIAQAAG